MDYVVYGIFWLISLLPLRVLYILSDALYGLAFYIVKYRRDVVMNNLKIAFPEKTEEERLRIAKKFYHNLVDTFIETIKMISASDKFILRHFTGNWEVLNNVYPTGRKVHLFIGHNFNWEWGNVAGAHELKFPFIGIYLPLSNKIFDRLFIKLRSRGGTILVRATHMREDILPHRNKQYLIGMAADQNPGHLPVAVWFNFFNRPTPFLVQPARAAIVNNSIAAFAFIRKKKRGYYEVVFTIAEENIDNTNEIELTGRFVKYLENVIRQYPDMWLWSHRRFRHEWKEEYGRVVD
jgi:KDO2-lipid IV(A) lauroyltransferase